MKLVRGGRLERPNLCWVCERTPAIDEPVVDTERYHDDWPAKMQGRKYVCEKCVTQMAGFFGFTTDDAIEKAELAQARAEAVIRGFKRRVDVLTKDLQTLAENPSVFMEESSVPEITPAAAGVGDGNSTSDGFYGTAGQSPVTFRNPAA